MMKLKQLPSVYVKCAQSTPFLKSMRSSFGIMVSSSQSWLPTKMPIQQRISTRDFSTTPNTGTNPPFGVTSLKVARLGKLLTAEAKKEKKKLQMSDSLKSLGKIVQKTWKVRLASQLTAFLGKTRNEFIELFKYKKMLMIGWI